MSTAINLALSLDHYAAYPKRIRPIVLMADTQPQFRSALTPLSMAVFRSLVARLNLRNPLQPIKVKMTSLADEIGCSSRTAQRALKAILDKGWLQFNPDHDGRNWRGRFTYREFIFDRSVLPVLGIDWAQPPEDEDLQVDQELPQIEVDFLDVNASEMSDGYNVNLNTNKDKIYEGSCGKPENQNLENHCDQKIDGITLPAELECLLDLGIYDRAACNLRKQARLAGYRLQDVVTVAMPYVLAQGMTHGRLNNYLLALIAKQSDYRERADQIHRSNVGSWSPDEDHPITQAPRSRIVPINVAYKVFTGKGVRVQFYDDSAQVKRLDGRVWDVKPELMPALLRDIRDGVLTELRQ